jgi:hypothetical protein
MTQADIQAAPLRLLCEHDGMDVIRRSTIVVLAIGLIAGCASAGSAPAHPSAPSPGSSTTGSAPSADPARAAAVDAVVQEAMEARHLRAVIVRVTVDGKEIITKA